MSWFSSFNKQQVFCFFFIAKASFAFVGLFGFGMCLPIRAQEPAKSIAAKLDEICTKFDLPGMSAAVVNSEGLVQSQNVGVRKRLASDKIEATDRFPIGSNTKSMTATLAAVLVEAGKIQWNTTIGEVWPKAKDSDIHPQLRNVTLDQLLSHQSGLARDIPDLSKEAWVEFFLEKESPSMERRRMLKLVLVRKPSNPQGEFAYSNIGYAVIAAMLEARAQESFESLMKKHVFVPLQMHSAEFRSLQTAAKQTPVMWGHRVDGQPVDPRVAGAENPTVYSAAGTVHLSIEDYAKYARWQLSGNPEPVLKSKSTFDNLHQSKVSYTAPNAKYACGWICIDTAYGQALTHSGSNTNAFALIWIIPKADFAGIVCTNSGQPNAFSACDAMMTDLIGKFAAKSNSVSTKPREQESKSIDPKRLVGRYQLAPNFVFDVKLIDDHLMVGITNQPTQEVFADSPTVWSYKAVKASLEFQIVKDGNAHTLTLHQNGMSQNARRLED